jgi:trigger factor
VGAVLTTDEAAQRPSHAPTKRLFECIMKIDVNEISSVQRKVEVELPPEIVTTEFSKAYRALGKNVRVKGFRAGKAPRSVLQGIYGDEIKGQVRSQLVEESLGEIIKERNLQIVSRPEIEANELEEGRPFSFSAVFEVKPELQVKDYTGTQLEKVRLTISDEQVEQALERLRESHARLEPVEDRDVAERGDFVTVDFQGSIGGKAFSGGKGENYVVEIGSGQALPQFEEGLAGCKIGEPREVRVPYPDNYPNREIAGKSVDFTVILREIKRKVLPQLDDDFAKDHGECGSLEELKAAIRSRLQGELMTIQEEQLKEQLLGRIIEKNSFTPPPSMVERQTRYLMERHHDRAGRQSSGDTESGASTEEVRRSLEARAVRQVQATLLMEKIAQIENVTVADKDVQERIDQVARAAGERAKSVREYYSRPEARDELRAQLVFDRTVSFLLEQAQIKEVDPPV